MISSSLRDLSLSSARFRPMPVALPSRAGFGVRSLRAGARALFPQIRPTPPALQDTAQQQPATALRVDAPGGITEDQLKHLLVGKDLYLRGGYLGDAIAYNEHGRLNGHAAFGSYTLCAVRIDKVRLTKHKSSLWGRATGCTSGGAAL